ncbi:MAG: hydroxyacid dehydrogenase [Planctomycetes bacterium]|nr:hydroxyacid dehydrogenase [Planctomycetota bacterium]
MCKPTALYAPTVSHTERVFRPEVYARFLDRFDVTENRTNKNLTADEIAQKIRGQEALVTGWGVPNLTPAIMENADQLKIIAHSAGSVKGLLGQIWDKYIVPRRICVFSANHAIACNVAESTLGLILMATHRWMDQALAIRTKPVWKDAAIPSNGQYLNGSTVGVVSASKVGRETLKLLKPFDVKVLVYDPFLSDWEAGALGVEKADLDTLFKRSDIVTVHAPSIPETDKMITARHLALLRDGAVLVNTSRGSVLDQDALLAECQKGRLIAALDVTTPEPLPPDHPLRKLPNVIITPHVSGAGHYGYFKIGETTLQALEDHFADKPVQSAIRYETWARLA